MIISKKKFNEAVEKERKEDRKNLLAATKELNDIIAYSSDRDAVSAAKKKVKEIKNKSSMYKRMNEPCDTADEF